MKGEYKEASVNHKINYARRLFISDLYIKNVFTI